MNIRQSRIRLQEDELDETVTELSARSSSIRKQNRAYRAHIDALCRDRRLQYIYAREHRRLPGRKRMRPEIRAYMSDPPRSDPLYKHGVGLVPKKIVFKSSPRPAKSSGSPRKVAALKVDSSGDSSATPRGKALTTRRSDGRDGATSKSADSSPRSRTAKVRKVAPPKGSKKTGASPRSLVPHEKEPGRSAQRFMEENYNLSSAEEKLSNLKF